MKDSSNFQVPVELQEFCFMPWIHASSHGCDLEVDIPFCLRVCVISGEVSTVICEKPGLRNSQK